MALAARGSSDLLRALRNHGSVRREHGIEVRGQGDGHVGVGTSSHECRVDQLTAVARDVTGTDLGTVDLEAVSNRDVSDVSDASGGHDVASALGQAALGTDGLRSARRPVIACQCDRRSAGLLRHGGEHQRRRGRRGGRRRRYPRGRATRQELSRRLRGAPRQSNHSSSHRDPANQAPTHRNHDLPSPRSGAHGTRPVCLTWAQRLEVD